MNKALKNITRNWFVFFGYFSLFLLTIIAALQIYDANYKIKGRYEELASKDNAKLILLLKSRGNLEAIQGITIDKVFNPASVTIEQESKFNTLQHETEDSLNKYHQMSEGKNELETYYRFRKAWQLNNANMTALFGMLASPQEAIRFYKSVQRKGYEMMQDNLSSLSAQLMSEHGAETMEADRYFKKSISILNLLIVVRIAIIVFIGIIIRTVVERLRSKNKILQQTQTKLLQNQTHLLASQQISKTGSWELRLSEHDQPDKYALSWSDETYRIFGYKPGEIEVNSELFLLHVKKSEEERIRLAFQKSMEDRIPFEIEHEIILRNGETKFIYERSDIFYDANGKPEKMIGTCQDITERKLAEQKLTEAESEKHRLRDQINRQKINRQKEITMATIKAQEKERLELGRELHDNVNQILSSSKLFIESSVHNPERQEELLNRSKNLINSCIEELRKLSRFLTPPTLGDLTLKESINEIVDEYNQIDGGKTVDHVITDLNEDKLSDDLKISVYRIIQEQLNNIRKYAKASKVLIALKHGNNNISLHIEDNGCGFDVQAKRKGLGMTNIINRAETFNGEVRITSSPGKGCAIYINFRLNKASVVNILNAKEETQQEFYGTGS